VTKRPRSAARTIHVHAIVTLIVVAVTCAACSDDASRDLTFGQPRGGAAPDSTPELTPHYRDAVATLQRDDTAEEAKLALVQELAGDKSDAATAVLHVGTENPSVLVSMASIKGLGGRACEDIAAPLERLLENQQWQRRAWAAKILGDTRCRGALRKLTDKLQHERDGRVQQRLEAAIKALNEEV